MSNIALSLSGGGAKGAFTAGVLYHLDMRDFFDTRPVTVISGTSTGSLIGTLVARSQFAELKQIYAGGVRTHDVLSIAAGDGTFTLLESVAKLIGINIPDSDDELLEHNVDILALAAFIDKQNSIYGIDPLKQLIRNFIGHPGFVQILGNPNVDLIFNVVSMNSGDAVTFSSRDPKLSSTLMERALWASASQPVFMPLVDIDLTGDPVNKLFADGGLAQVNPIEPIFKSQLPYDGIIAIANSPDPAKQVYSDPLGSMKDILLRTLDVLLDDVTTNDLRVPQLVLALRSALTALAGCNTQTCDQVRKSFDADLEAYLQSVHFDQLKNIPIVYIAPDSVVMENGLAFDPDVMRTAFAKGEQVAEQHFAQLQNCFP